MKLQDMVREACIIPALTSDNRSGAVRELVEKLAAGGELPPDSVEPVIKSIIARERSRGSTGFGKGMAIPHTKSNVVSKVVAAVGRSEKGVDFSSLDGEPVFGIFLMVSPESDPDSHLKAIDLVFRHLMQERFRKFLRQSDTTEKIFDLLREADEELVA